MVVSCRIGVLFGVYLGMFVDCGEYGCVMFFKFWFWFFWGRLEVKVGRIIKVWYGSSDCFDEVFFGFELGLGEMEKGGIWWSEGEVVFCLGRLLEWEIWCLLRLMLVDEIG